MAGSFLVLAAHWILASRCNLCWIHAKNKTKFDFFRLLFKSPILKHLKRLNLGACRFMLGDQVLEVRQ